MSFELQDQGDGWRLRAALLTNGGEGFHPSPTPRSATERFAAMIPRLGIRPGTVRFIAVSISDAKRKRGDLALLAFVVVAGSVLIGVILPASTDSGSLIRALLPFAAILLLSFGALNIYSRRLVRLMLTVVLTDTHLLVIEGDGGHVHLRSEMPADAITHATVDESDGPRKPVGITLHGSHGPVHSFKSANLSRIMAELALYEAGIPLAEGPNGSAPWSDYRPGDTRQPGPADDQ